MGSYVRRRSNWFGDDTFVAGRPNINTPDGLGDNTAIAPLQSPRGVIAAVIAPTPHQRPGDRPNSMAYELYVQANSRRYQRVASRLSAPVIVVVPNEIRIYQQ